MLSSKMAPGRAEDDSPKTTPSPGILEKYRDADGRSLMNVKRFSLGAIRL
jgi:hypothetical protein